MELCIHEWFINVDLLSSSNGEIRLFDIRTKTSVQNWSAGSDITNIAVHATADIVAWLVFITSELMLNMFFNLISFSFLVLVNIFQFMDLMDNN